jgi:hypothetical protein
VRNRHYRQWRKNTQKGEEKGNGSDLLLFSNAFTMTTALALTITT